MSITSKQIQLIHIAKGQLGLSDEEYRALLCTRYPDCFSGSCKELTYDQATDLIEHLKVMGFTIKGRAKKQRRPRRARLPEGITGLPTPAQWDKIDALAHAIEWRAGLEKGLRGFTRRMLGHQRPRSVEEAQKLIEHLKHLKFNQQRSHGRRP